MEVAQGVVGPRKASLSGGIREDFQIKCRNRPVGRTEVSRVESRCRQQLARRCSLSPALRPAMTGQGYWLRDEPNRPDSGAPTLAGEMDPENTPQREMSKNGGHSDVGAHGTRRG